MDYGSLYRILVDAINTGTLTEPFGVAAFRTACPGFAEGTYRAFLWKSSAGDDRVLEKVGPGKFKLIRPVKHRL